MRDLSPEEVGSHLWISGAYGGSEGEGEIGDAFSVHPYICTKKTVDTSIPITIILKYNYHQK